MAAGGGDGQRRASRKGLDVAIGARNGQHGFSTIAEVRSVIGRVTDDLPGYLLSSGRHFHYYGMQLLDSEAWIAFLAQFLMPCVLVSPRYIGHSMHRGFCALRLNAVPPHKPIVPVLVAGECRG